jgi:hypothetical protein
MIDLQEEIVKDSIELRLDIQLPLDVQGYLDWRRNIVRKGEIPP